MGQTRFQKRLILTILILAFAVISGCSSTDKTMVIGTLIELGSYEKALELADEQLKRISNNTAAMNQKSVCLIYLKREEEALTVLQEILSIDNDDDAALSNMAWALYNLSRYDEAIRYSDQALAVEPNDIVEYTNRGNIFFSLKRYEEAKEAYEKALYKDSSNANALYGLGSAYYWLEDYPNAITQFNKYLIYHPTDADAMIYLGYAYLYQGDTDIALQELERLAKHIGNPIDNPDLHFEALVLKAECKIASQRYDEAITALESAEIIHSDDENVYRLFGEAYLAAGNLSSSIAAYNRMASLAPTQAYPFIQNVYNHLDRNDITSATKSAERAIELEPKNAEAYNAIGNIYGRQTQYRQAYHFFQQAVILNPDYITGHVNSMWALYNSGLYKKCIDYGNALLHRFPEDADIYGYMGDCWSMLNDSDAAIKNYITASKLAPDLVFYKYQIALTHYMAQNYEDARNTIEEALSLDPANELYLSFKEELELKKQPLPWQIADFVEKYYLYAGDNEDLARKLAQFKALPSTSGEQIYAFIDGIRKKDDIFTFCLIGDDYKWYQQMGEGIAVTNKMILPESGKDVHYFHIEYFGKNTANQFINAAEAITGKENSILVIDLVDNGGGDLNSCVEILDYMLGSCVVGNLIYRDGSVSPYYSDADAVSFEHIYILVNGNSASSSELLTLGLKKYLPNVTIVGQPTLGKGVGQVAFESKEENIAILLVNFYWNVKEENVMNNSIQPDVKVTGDHNQYIKKVSQLLK